MPRSPGHVYYDRLQQVLVGAGFGGFVEDACRAYYAKTMGAPSVPPGPLLSDAHGRVLRGDRQRARDRVALFGLALVTRVSSAGDPRPGSGPFLDVEDAGPLAS